MDLELIHIIALKDNKIYDLRKENRKIQEQLSLLVCSIYEHANEGTELMEIAERIDEMEQLPNDNVKKG